ncbi:MAG TPA: TonB-dependent receptor plug domain-containing protein, partial [Gemmatimonadales bacterium]|nr:TonB-dependent receptor plug domain-containing protein [Gemmatimonadales bacterium]
KQTIDGAYTAALPVDAIGAVLALQPGVVSNPAGTVITIRGGRTDEAVTYVDGVPVTPGGRGGQFVGVPPGVVDVSTASLEQAAVTTGSSSAEFGNAQSGVIAIQTRAGGSRWSGNASFENDDIGGLNHSLGFNRIQAGLGGPITNHLSFFLSGDLQGQKSAPFGLDNQNYPVFVAAGVDTTVAVPSSTTPADTTQVDVLKFAMYTGECDAFSQSSNPDIRSNYGFGCRGARIPASAVSTYRGQAKLQYSYGTGSRLALTGLRSQTQTRIFNYGNLNNPQALFGNYTGNNVVTLNWTQNLAKSADRALALELYASYQWDRVITSPLTTSGEAATRDPFGGFMIKPMDFQFDFSNFDITNLASDFRTNTGRLTPFDLNKRDEYQLIDNYRNNAYAAQGGGLGAASAFSDGGGPASAVSRLSLYKEDRAVGKGNLDWQVDRYNRLKLGGEYTKYYMNSYSSLLTSQAFSDAYHERPTRWNAFVEDRLDLGDVVLVGGLRYDWYKTGAARPYYIADTLGNLGWYPRVSTMPGYDPANPT